MLTKSFNKSGSINGSTAVKKSCFCGNLRYECKVHAPDSVTQYHTGKQGGNFYVKLFSCFFCYQGVAQTHKQKTVYKAAARTCQYAYSARERMKNGQACNTEKNVQQYCRRASFSANHKQGDKYRKGLHCKRDYGRNTQPRAHTDNYGKQGGQSQIKCFIPHRKTA